jgi:hypothetical protein
MRTARHMRRSLLRSTFILILTATLTSHAPAQTSAQPSGLVGWWPGDGDTVDLSGHNLPGTLQDNATFSPGKVGQAFVFDGDGDWVDLGDQTGDFGANDFSIALWVRFDTLDGEQVLMEDYVEPPGVGWSLSKHTDNRLFFGWDTGQQVNIPSGLVAALQWHHVAVTRAGTTFTIYLDGIAQDVQTQSPSLASSAHLKLGMRGEPAETPGHFYLHGALDDAQIYSRALSTAEIQTIVNSSPSDTTAPEITPDIQGILGDNGWYISDITVSWNVVDHESAISSTSGCGPTTITSDTAGTTLTCSATSDGGTSTETVTIKRDATAPVLSPIVSPDPILLNGSATAAAGASDNLSGISSQGCDTLNISSVGAKTVTCSAVDGAGNSTSASAAYSVVYRFDGFFPPVDNPPVLNVARAGRKIPLRWRLTDANGAPITNLANVTVTVATRACGLHVTRDVIETYATGAPGLRNHGNGYYQFNWKAPAAYARSCKTLWLDLGEASPRTADFRFTK